MRTRVVKRAPWVVHRRNLTPADGMFRFGNCDPDTGKFLMPITGVILKC